MTKITHLAQRGAGLLLAAGILFVLDLDNAHALQQLWLPLGLAVAAYLMTRSLMAVGLATLALAVVHIDFSSAGWVEAWAYPLIALGSFIVCATVALGRFRRHVADTHEARWAQRKTRRS